VLNTDGCGINIVDCSVAVSNVIVAHTKGGICAGGYSGDLRVFHATIVDSNINPAITIYHPDITVLVQNSVIAFNPGGDFVPTMTNKYNIRWQSGLTGYPLDATEKEIDPLFVDLSANNFHLKSQAGHYDVATDRWLADEVTSPAIDSADPSSPYNRETMQNGGRANCGAYGNTAQASRSVIIRFDAGVGFDGRFPYDARLPFDSFVDVDGGTPGDSTWVDRGVLTDSQVTDSDLDGAVGDTVDSDTSVSVDDGARWFAYAGPDLTVTAPVVIHLNGDFSRAPAGARYSWTRRTSPKDSTVQQIADTPTADVNIDRVGLWTFELSIEAGGVVSSDVVQIHARDTERSDGLCQCAGDGASPPGVSFFAIGLLIWLRVRPRQKDTVIRNIS
jgi:hypothetical protein